MMEDAHAVFTEVSVFHGAHFLGLSEHHNFLTNGGRQAIQNSSTAAFCPYCGELWLRAVHRTALPYWRVVPVPCLKHVDIPSLHSDVWGTLAWVLPPPERSDQAVVELEFNWWMKRLDAKDRV